MYPGTQLFEQGQRVRAAPPRSLRSSLHEDDIAHRSCTRRRRTRQRCWSSRALRSATQGGVPRPRGGWRGGWRVALKGMGPLAAAVVRATAATARALAVSGVAPRFGCTARSARVLQISEAGGDLRGGLPGIRMVFEGDLQLYVASLQSSARGGSNQRYEASWSTECSSDVACKAAAPI
eukprot:6206266-Pleurochrysis_carterae.AAC.4